MYVRQKSKNTIESWFQSQWHRFPYNFKMVLRFNFQTWNYANSIHTFTIVFTSIFLYTFFPTYIYKYIYFTFTYVYVYFIVFHSSVSQYIMTEVLFILVAGAFKYFHIQFNLHSWYWKNIFHITSFQYFKNPKKTGNFYLYFTKHYNNTINFFHLNFQYFSVNIKY